jgi:hypothetical protein
LSMLYRKTCIKLKKYLLDRGQHAHMNKLSWSARTNTWNIMNLLYQLRQPKVTAHNNRKIGRWCALKMSSQENCSKPPSTLY